MKVLFVCSSLEPGRDGVGDYTLRLAEEIHKTGHETHCVALNDSHITNFVRGVDLSAESFTLWRMPSSTSWRIRWREFEALLSGVRPDWLSLQFVPWGFHKKGLPIRLGSNIHRLARGTPIHLMCHELWLQGSAFSIKQRALGICQKWTARRLFTSLQPQLVNTHLAVYRELLCAMRVDATLLPLCGNIPISSSRAAGRDWLRTRLGLDEDDQCLGFFGEIHTAVDEDALTKLMRQRQTRPGNVVILSAGQLTAAGKKAWYRVTTACSGLAKSFTLGCLSQEDVSKYLQGLDVGLTSYPPEYVGKSGGVAAMLEHGVAVCVLGRQVSSTDTADDPHYLLPEEGRSVSATARHLLELFAVAEGVASSTSRQHRVSL